MRPSAKIVNSRRFSWPLGLYRVAGDSMRPTLEPGQLLLGWRWSRAKAGDIVVARHGRPLVKRLAALAEPGAWLVGDNPAASTDSRHFGHLSPALIEAVIVWPRHAAN